MCCIVDGYVGDSVGNILLVVLLLVRVFVLVMLTFFVMGLVMV